ncbi:MAG TPA: MFS transporter [Candidatus Dormibacteraeota bacterium]
MAADVAGAGVGAPARFGWARHLGLSAGWFGFNFHWLPIPLVLVPNQVLALVPHSQLGSGIAAITATGAIFAVTVPPLVGHWSDRLTTRWGRRRPILVAGTLGDLVGLALLGTAHSYAQLLVGYVLIQFFYNAAGAAYAGMIPDVVPEAEFGSASGWLGAMNQFGGVVGVGVASVLAGFGHANSTYGVIGVVVLVTLVPVLITARGEGLTPLPERARMPFGQAAKEFVRPLAQGNFAWVIFTRFMVTAGIWVVANFLLPFFHDVARVPNAAQFTATFLLIVYLTATPTGFVGGLVSDRLGRKPFVYASGAFQAFVALIFIVFYPTAVPILIALGAIYGLGFGLYYAVDWALACDTLPDPGHAAKDMGLFHVAFTLPQVLVPSIAGPVLDYFNHSSPNSGYRVIFSAAVVFMLLGSYFVSRIRGVR